MEHSKKASIMITDPLSNKIARGFMAQTDNVDPNAAQLDPSMLQQGQSVFNNQGEEFVVVNADPTNTEKIIMPKNQQNAETPDGVETVDDQNLVNNFYLQSCEKYSKLIKRKLSQETSRKDVNRSEDPSVLIRDEMGIEEEWFFLNDYDDYDEFFAYAFYFYLVADLLMPPERYFKNFEVPIIDWENIPEEFITNRKDYKGGKSISPDFWDSKNNSSVQGNKKYSDMIKRKASFDENPKIYVGTYNKYNNGSLKGKWFDLTDYANVNEFYKAATEFHSDEHDPELMFQGWEYIPDNFIGESWINKDFWEYMELTERMSEPRKEAFDVYLNNEGDLTFVIETFDEAYMGMYDSLEEYGKHKVDELGGPENAISSDDYYDHIDFDKFSYDLEKMGRVPEGMSPKDYAKEVVDDIGEEHFIDRYFDYAYYGRELRHDYYEDSGHVFIKL